jgi:hypothetical protein
MMMAGRKTKYTPETVDRIIQAIRLGATYQHAAAYGGISFETLNEWRKRKPEFSEQLNKAEGDGVMVWLAKIEKAASDGNWQAAAWKLERRYPDQYGKQARIEVSDWRSEAIRLIQTGELDYRALAEAFDDTLAADLFRAAGVSVQVGEGEAP